MSNILYVKVFTFLAQYLKLLSFFNINPKGKKLFTWVVTILFILIVFGISSKFIMRTISRANQCDLWTDERNGISTRNASYSALIKGELASQVSKAPFDYIALKLFDEVGKPFIFERVSKNIYYRLNSIFYNWFSGLCIILVAFFHIKKDPQNYLVFGVQILFLVAALLIYYFWPYNLRFSVEMRPYALWNSLWFMIMAFFLIYQKFNRLVCILLILLAGTASSSIFQLFSLALSFFFIHCLRKEKVEELIIIIFKVFALPAAIALYYILIDIGGKYAWSGNSEQYLKEFFHFWITKEMIPILSIIGILMTYPFKKLQNYTIVFSTILFLYIISPFINYLVISRGVFFSSRHYIYYDLIYPLFFINIALILPHYWEKISQYFSEGMSKT